MSSRVYSLPQSIEIIQFLAFTRIAERFPGASLSKALLSQLIRRNAILDLIDALKVVFFPHLTVNKHNSGPSNASLSRIRKRANLL
jgi:hypothetical protein